MSLTEGQHYIEIAHCTYKYLCVKDFPTQTRIKGFEVETKYLRLMKCGALWIKKNYATDGCSGPTMDDRTNMQAGFMHDGLYQLLRMGKLHVTRKDFKAVRKLADLSFKDQLKIDGMPWVRRNYYYWGVRLGGEKHAMPRNRIFEATDG